MKHVGEPVRPPRELNPEIPEELDVLVTKLLAKDPEARYKSAAELAEDLRRLRGGLPPIIAREDAGATRVASQATVPVPPTAARVRDRRRTPRALAAILALLALIGGGWALSQGLWDSLLGEPGQPSGVEVPDVEGLTEEQARQKLTDSGFEADVRRQESSATDAGKVLKQSPPAGKRVEGGSGVVIGVGNGLATVRVPDVVGLSLSEAEVTLGEAKLTVGSKGIYPATRRRRAWLSNRDSRRDRSRARKHREPRDQLGTAAGGRPGCLRSGISSCIDPGDGSRVSAGARGRR